MAAPLNFSPVFRPTYLWGTGNTPNTTPFIPTTPLPAVRPSPYRDIADLPDEDGPNTGQRRVHFEDEVPPTRGRTISLNQQYLRPPLTPHHIRRRSDSLLPQPVWLSPAVSNVPMAWNGVVSSPLSPNIPITWATPVPSPVASPVATNVPLGWNTFTPIASPAAGLLFLPPQPSVPTPFQIHPFLDGQAPRPEFVFDLSRPDFAPVKYVHVGTGLAAQPVPLTHVDLREAATHPPVARMRITHDRIPQWPIDIQLSPSEAQAILQSNGTLPPINLGEVLFAIHRMLHRQITHIDWAKIGVSDEEAISRAYTRRCKLVPAQADTQRSQGVKRIDYLLDRFMFKGLIRAAGDSQFSEWKLITA